MFGLGWLGLLLLIPGWFLAGIFLGEFGVNLDFFMAFSLATLCIMLPFLTANITITMTVSDVTSPDYELLKVTPLSNRTLVESYYYASLYIVSEILWSVIIMGLILWIGGIALALTLVYSGAALSLVILPVALGFGIWWLFKLIIALGVLLSLWWRDQTLALIGTLAVPFSFAAGYTLAWVILEGWWGVPAVFAAAPLLLTGLALKTAESYVRRMPS